MTMCVLPTCRQRGNGERCSKQRSIALRCKRYRDRYRRFFRYVGFSEGKCGRAASRQFAKGKSIRARISDRLKFVSDLRRSQRERNCFQSLEPRDYNFGRIRAPIALSCKSEPVGVLRTVVLAGRQTACSSRRSAQCHGRQRSNACQNCRDCEACKQPSHRIARLHPLSPQTRHFQKRFRIIRQLPFPYKPRVALTSPKQLTAFL